MNRLYRLVIGIWTLPFVVLGCVASFVFYIAWVGLRAGWLSMARELNSLYVEVNHQ